MTAPLLSTSLESASVGSPFSHRSLGSTSNRHSTARRPSDIITHQRFRNSKLTPQIEVSELDLIWGSLIETLQQGVIVVSCNLKLVYWNLKSKELCQLLSGSQSQLELPVEVSEICHRLIRENSSTKQSLVMERQSAVGPMVRISVRWLHPNLVHDNTAFPFPDLGNSAIRSRQQENEQQRYILIFLEDCSDRLRQELRIEQQKYDLTEREAEVWMLLRQEYTYQEIAKMLQISLNTVKTHVKNVYAKRRSCQGQEKFWCCE